MKVLTLEDEALISMLIDETLSDAGYAVECASTVAQALALLEQERFDVAVLDIRLQSGNSDTVARALFTRSIPFAFCSGSDTGLKPEFADVPVLGKPFAGNELLALLARLVSP